MLRNEMRGQRSASSKPLTRFLFSHEANYEVDEGCSSWCHLACPHCNTQVIDIYLDRILREVDVRILSFETDTRKARFVMYRIDQIVFHELAHWAGCNEEQAWAMEDWA